MPWGVSEFTAYRLGKGPAGWSEKNMNLFVRLNLQLSYVHRCQGRCWGAARAGGRTMGDGGQAVSSRNHHGPEQRGTRIWVCEPMLWNLPGLHRMGMKSSLENMATGEECWHSLFAEGKPDCTQCQGMPDWHSWDNELCVAAGALMPELTDFYAVRAKGKTHKVRCQELEAGTHGTNYAPSSASALPSEPTHRPPLWPWERCGWAEPGVRVAVDFFLKFRASNVT